MDTGRVMKPMMMMTGSGNLAETLRMSSSQGSERLPMLNTYTKLGTIPNMR